MSKNTMSADLAQEIVDTLNRVEYMEEKLGEYSVGKRLDGRLWNIRKVNDSRHWDARNMLDKLPQEDYEAVNKYIRGKFRKAIRDGKAHLKELGVNDE